MKKAKGVDESLASLKECLLWFLHKGCEEGSGMAFVASDALNDFAVIEREITRPQKSSILPSDPLATSEAPSHPDTE